MAKRSAGLLLWRRHADRLQVLLVHPGGPFWARKDDGVWSVPKGEYAAGEDPQAVARREFREELGELPPLDVRSLGEIAQRGGKIVSCFAAHGDFDAATVRSNTFELEWPPRSGRRQTFPEVDRAQWFDLDEARVKINPAQRPFLDRLERIA